MMRIFAISNKNKALSLLKKSVNSSLTNHLTTNHTKQSFTTTTSFIFLNLHSKKRKRYDYSTNHSAALALPVSTPELNQKKNDSDSLVNLSKDLIVEHAARRVDLFFYTLIAYYQTQASPQLGHTELQHGRGRSSHNINITQACHSSFTPSLIDENMNSEEYTSILHGTHFMDSINSTIELPAIVNKFDDELENTYSCRKKSLEIIRQVSLGKINPIQGLNQFLNMMHMTFNLIPSSSPVKDKIIKLEKQGTFVGKFSSDLTVTDEYIELLLRLTNQEKIASLKKAGNKIIIYLGKIKELQHEILNTKSQHNHKITS